MFEMEQEDSKMEPLQVHIQIAQGTTVGASEVNKEKRAKVVTVGDSCALRAGELC